MPVPAGVAPGFKTLTIRPQLCDLTWAKGSVPTPQGNVAVAWKREGNTLSLDVTVPAGSEAEIILPTEQFDQPRVTLNGSPASGKIHVKAGRSQVELSGIFNPKM